MNFEIHNFKLSNFWRFLPTGYVHSHQRRPHSGTQWTRSHAACNRLGVYWLVTPPNLLNNWSEKSHLFWVRLVLIISPSLPCLSHLAATASGKVPRVYSMLARVRTTFVCKSVLRNFELFEVYCSQGFSIASNYKLISFLSNHIRMYTVSYFQEETDTVY